MATILVVDDQEKNRYLLKVMLEASGHSVIEASNGAEGLRYLSNHFVDLIISDVLMPQMDGFAFCYTCKQNEKLKDIPFIFYTATYTDERDQTLGLSLGATRYITKPVSYEDLVGIVNEILQQPSSFSPNQSEVNLQEEQKFYKLYNEALIRKLEDKMLELHKANQLLQAKEEQIQALVNVATEGIVFHRNGLIIHTNPKFVQMVGHQTEEEIHGHSIHEWVLFSTPLESIHICKKENVKVQEVIIRRKDGSEFPAEITLSCYRYKGEDLGTITVRDITNYKKAEEEKKRLQNLLNQIQKMECIGRLAGGMAHDFNNVLSVILGYTELAISQLPLSHPSYEPLKEVIQSVDRASAIVRQLLTFSRKQSIEPHPIDINQEIEKALSMLQRLIGEHIELKWILSPNLDAIFIDPIQINQILINLCVNARDAIGSKQGQIIIQTEKQVLSNEFLGHHESIPPGSYIVLSVSDNGEGMTEEVKQHLFEPFFTTKKPGMGTGLGLATVYGIVKQNQGYIDVKSECGRGTTFSIFFPAITSLSNQRSSLYLFEKELCNLKGRGESILIVEDDVSIRELCRLTLEQAGYQVWITEPNHISNFLDSQHYSIHLLITDLIMPYLYGNEIVKQIQHIFPTIKVLYMSGYDLESIQEKGISINLTCNHFLKKPFSQQTLLTRVRQILDS